MHNYAVIVSTSPNKKAKGHLFSSNHTLICHVLSLSAKISSIDELYGGPLHSNMLSYVTIARPFGEMNKRASTQYEQSSATGKGSRPFS